jgi:osmotically-inducible protein OsmY
MPRRDRWSGGGGGAARHGDELSDALCLALEKDAFINAPRTWFTSKEGVATLAGLVPNETMKRMAERDAWFVLGVREVVNKIAVKW